MTSRREIPTVLGESGRFPVVRELGRGATAVSYLVRDRHQPNRRLAAKLCVLTGDGPRRRFRAEFEASTRVDHPNVARAHELHVDGGDPFFTLDLVEGQDFVTFARGHGRAHATLDHGSLVRLRGALRGATAGLRAIHSAGLVHRDLRPPNLLVTFSGRAVLVDHGLATSYDVEASVDDGRPLGLPAYLAPERLAEPRRPPSPLEDWYALGVVLFEALVGAQPFAGNQEQQALSKRQVPAPAVLSVAPKTPRELAVLCDGLLASEPARRAEAVADVEATLAS